MLKDIARAINKKLKEAFPDIEITSKDITEGFTRPSFFVDFDRTTAKQLTATLQERNITVIIYYFPKNRQNYKIEMLDVQEKTELAFQDVLTVDDNTFIHTGEIEAIKADGVLQLSFDLSYVVLGNEDKQGDNNEMMEELYLKG